AGAALILVIAFVLERLGVRSADAVAALIIGVVIARTAWVILKANIDVLADGARLNPEQVRQVVMAVAGVRGAHKIRSRGTSDQVAVDMHIFVDPNMTLA